MSPRRFVVTSLLALALGGAASGLVACGDRNGLIPPDQGNAIVSDLEKAQADFDAKDCDGALTNVRRAGDKVVALPRAVDPELRRNLRDGVQTAINEVVKDCDRTSETTTTETTPPTQTETTPTQTTPTETIPTQTTPTQTTPPTTTDPATSGGTPIDPTSGSGPNGDERSGEQKSSGRGGDR